jgi:hypothetical protein
MARYAITTTGVCQSFFTAPKFHPASAASKEMPDGTSGSGNIPY